MTGSWEPGIISPHKTGGGKIGGGVKKEKPGTKLTRPIAKKLSYRGYRLEKKVFPNLKKTSGNSGGGGRLLSTLWRGGARVEFSSWKEKAISLQREKKAFQGILGES